MVPSWSQVPLATHWALAVGGDFGKVKAIMAAMLVMITFDVGAKQGRIKFCKDAHVGHGQSSDQLLVVWSHLISKISYF